MVIHIIQQSTDERKKEIEELFENIKPLLDEGYIYSSACKKIKGISSNQTLSRSDDAWFRELVEYGESQGYLWNNYSGKGEINKR